MKSTYNFSVIQLLKQMPLDKLSLIAEHDKVDYKAKKLTAMRMLCMMTCAFLESTRLSQRFIGEEWANHSFSKLFGQSLQEGKVSHSSISTRLDTMNVKFFEDSYQLITDIGEQLTTQEERAAHNIVRVDSSMVQDVLDKLKEGIKVGRKSSHGYKDRKQLKYTIAFDGFKVLAAKIFKSKEYASEDLAIPETVKSAIFSSKYHSEIYVFDRGVSSTQRLGEIDEATSAHGDVFVGRLKLSRKILDGADFTTKGQRENDDLTVLSDITGHLNSKSDTPDGHLYRFISVRLKKDRQPTRTAKGKRRIYDDEVLLITNDFKSSALDICGYYKRRWDIEVFYKFLKQNLSMAHILSSSDNGLKIILYMMLIVATMVMIFEHQNNLGPKDAIQIMKIQLINWAFDHPCVSNEEAGNVENKKT